MDSEGDGRLSGGRGHSPGEASRAILGKWGRRKVNLRRSISADSLAGSLVHFDSGISVCDWGRASLFTHFPSSFEVGGDVSQVGGVGPAADWSGCNLLGLSTTSSSVGMATNTAAEVSNDDTLIQDTTDDIKGEMEGEIPIQHVIPQFGEVWCGPGVKKSQSVTERLQHGSVRAASLRNDLLVLLGQAEMEDGNLQEAAEELAAFRRCGDVEQEVERERQLLLSRERREAALSRAEAMASAACNSRVQDGAHPLSRATATVTISSKGGQGACSHMWSYGIHMVGPVQPGPTVWFTFCSDLCVTVSPVNTLGSESRPERCCANGSFLCLVRDTVDGSVVATEVEKVTGIPGGDSRELVFHSTMRWCVSHCS